MLPETIEKLLNSKNPDDNKIAWEMIKDQRIAYVDILDYMERTKVPIHYQYKYWFNSNTMTWERSEEEEEEDY